MNPSATEPSDLPPLRDVIARYGLETKKSLGQHFLLDLNLTGRIARAAGDLSQGTVIEVGPGPGGLTRALLAAGASRVIAVERDGRCIEALEDLSAAYPGRLKVVEGDALETDLSALGPPPRKIVANLPYNISAPLLIGWLKRIDDFTGLTLMFQKEVAHRLAAAPGSKDYGRLSVMSQWLCEVEVLFNIDKRAFTPPPKVASSVVGLTPHASSRAAPLAPTTWAAMEQVVQAAFGQRRKMLRASLKSLSLNPEDLGIDPTKRAEDLSVEQFCILAKALSGQELAKALSGQDKKNC